MPFFDGKLTRVKYKLVGLTIKHYHKNRFTENATKLYEITHPLSYIVIVLNRINEIHTFFLEPLHY